MVYEYIKTDENAISIQNLNQKFEEFLNSFDLDPQKKANDLGF